MPFYLCFNSIIWVVSFPKISIITVVFNGEFVLERTIKSVLAQSYKNIEYILIDGLSTDGTSEIIDRYKSNISILVSEKDNGIYDAMNKGLEKATGDYVLFLNAGDEFYDTAVLSKVFDNSTNADVYYGSAMVVDELGNELGERRLTPPEKLTWTSFKLGMCVSHQSFIARRSLCKPYDLRYQISSDIDWVITILKKSHSIQNTKLIVSKFLVGGASSSKRKQGLKERFVILKKHYGTYVTLLSHIIILLRYAFHLFTKKSMT